MPNGVVEAAGVAVFWKWAATALLGVSVAAGGYVINDITETDVTTGEVTALESQVIEHIGLDDVRDAQAALGIEGLRQLENAHFEEIIRRLANIERRLPGGTNE